MYVENRTKIANFPTPVYLPPALKGFPLEFCIGAGVSRNQSDVAFRWLKKFADRFSRFDAIPECDGHPASHPARHVALAITLNAKASSLKMTFALPLNISSASAETIVAEYSTSTELRVPVVIPVLSNLSRLIENSFGVKVQASFGQGASFEPEKGEPPPPKRIWMR